jgi:GNAT superfamily N-acetyltransferase
MKLQYVDDVAKDAQEVAALISMGLGKRMPSEVEIAFRNSSVRCFVLDHERLVGVGRAVSDGVFYAIIFDVVVHPEYRGRGIGTEIMKRLIASAHTKRVLLYAAPGKEPFYRKLGFLRMKTAMALFEAPAWYQDNGYLEKEAQPTQRGMPKPASGTDHAGRAARQP